MSKLKIHPNFLKIFTAFLLLLFVASKSVALLHGFAHFSQTSKKITEIENKSFFSQIIFSHSQKESSKNSEESCLWSAFNLQNQSNFFAALTFSFAAFSLIFFTRFFDRSKISYLFSSYLSQAPPLNS